MKTYLGVDIGGTRIKVVVLNHEKEIIDREQFSTEDSKPEEQLWKSKVIEIINNKTYEFAEGDKSKMICGISAPGLANDANDLIWHMPKRLNGIENFNWGRELDREIWVINDAHSATFAEYNMYFASEVKNMILLTLGTGVGGGIILNGKLFKGYLGRAGHFGHVTLDSNGPMTMTNLPGSFEYAMGNFSIEKRTHGQFNNTYDLVEAYKKGHPLATYWWLSSIKKVALGIASLNNAFAPEVFVVGGGIAGAGESFFKPLHDFMSLYEWKLEDQHVKIVRARFGQYAGAVGAALFAKENHKNKINEYS